MISKRRVALAIAILVLGWAGIEMLETGNKEKPRRWWQREKKREPAVFWSLEEYYKYRPEKRRPRRQLRKRPK